MSRTRDSRILELIREHLEQESGPLVHPVLETEYAKFARDDGSLTPIEWAKLLEAVAARLEQVHGRPLPYGSRMTILRRITTMVQRDGAP